MAGIQIASIIVVDRELRQKIEHALNMKVCCVNTFVVESLEATYKQGAEWLKELKLYLYKNYEVALRLLNEKLPQLQVLPLFGLIVLGMGFLPKWWFVC